MGKRKKKADSKSFNVHVPKASPYAGTRVTVGLPLPKLIDARSDVSFATRSFLDQMYAFSDRFGIRIEEKTERGLNVADNHNKLVNRMEGEWFLMVGSDHGFGQDALMTLLDAAMQPPFPRIIAGTIGRRNEPFGWVMTRLDARTQTIPNTIVPYLDFDMGEVLAGHVKKLDAVGSGFTLYHRSVFDKLVMNNGYPWFQYSRMSAPMPLAEETLYDWNGKMSVSTYLERLADGDESVNPLLLKKKAADIRTLLGHTRRVFAYGPDYFMCLAAGNIGVESFVHFGCRVLHFDWLPIDPGEYFRRFKDTSFFWKMAMQRVGSTTSQAVQEIKEFMEKQQADADKSADQLLEEFKNAVAEKPGEGQALPHGEEGRDDDDLRDHGEGGAEGREDGLPQTKEEESEVTV